jgi:hypothetical protein
MPDARRGTGLVEEFPMRSLLIAALLAATAVPSWAQDTTIIIRSGRRASLRELSVRDLPRDVADEVIRFYNAEHTLRFSGQTRIPEARGVDGDVAVLGGPVTIGGHISGSLLVVNGDLTFEPGAVVSGDVTVVGGSILAADRASVAGEIRAYRDPLRYRRTGEDIAYSPRRQFRPSWLNRPDDLSGNRTGFTVSLGGIYNRVEGLPLVFGPDADLRLAGDARLQLDARGIFRTAGDWSLERGDFGYRARAELVLGGRQSNLGLGVRGYDLMNSVEPWPLKDFEVGWSAFLFHRDYRDYYSRRGASLYATLRVSPRFSATAEGRSERQGSVTERDPFTLFRSEDLWRVNPAITDGHYDVLTGSVRYDTRNDKSTPTAGLFLNGEWELGHGTDVSSSPCSAPGTVCATFWPGLADGTTTYQRLFFDLRSYSRLSPSGRLNLRIAGGGWLAGDPLPLQRRLALGYPDPLPGYGFRALNCGGEQYAGNPAFCDRALLAQAEFRTHLGLDIGPDWATGDFSGDEQERYEPFHVSGPDLVVFADAGRAWQVGEGAGRIPSNRLPAFNTFKTDVGVGLDFGPIGFYLAKSLDRAMGDVTFSVRMGRRF